MRAAALLFLTALILGVAGCSTSQPEASPTAAPAASDAPQGASPKSTVRAPDANPSVGSSAASAPPTVTAAEKPFDAYIAMDDDPLPWLGQFYAASGMPVDYAAAAQRLDPAYQGTHDAFAQRDALAAFKTRLDQAITQAKANPYIRLPAYQAKVPPYDLDRGRYDLTQILGSDTLLTVAANAAEVRFTPPGALAHYAPKDEAEARATEKTLGGEPFPRAVHANVYGKVVGGTINRGMPQLQVVPARVALTTLSLGGPGEPVFTATVP